MMGRLSNLSAMGAVTTLSDSQAAPTIWNSISAFEKTFAGLNDSDYAKLQQWLSNAYAGGYVVDQYDDPSQIQVPSVGQITALIQQFNNGVYSPDEISSAATNVQRLIAKGFIIRPFIQSGGTATSIPAPLMVPGSAFNPGTPTTPQTLTQQIGSAAGTIAQLFAPTPQYGFNTPAIVKRQAPPKEVNPVPWLLGFAGLTLFGVIVFTVLKKKK